MSQSNNTTCPTCLGRSPMWVTVKCQSCGSTGHIESDSTCDRIFKGVSTTKVIDGISICPACNKPVAMHVGHTEASRDEVMAMPFDELVEKRKAEASKPIMYKGEPVNSDHGGTKTIEVENVHYSTAREMMASKPDDKMPNCLMCYDTGLTSRGRYSGQPCRNSMHYEPTHKKLDGVDGYYGDDIPVDESKPDFIIEGEDVGAARPRFSPQEKEILYATPQADKGIERLELAPGNQPIQPRQEIVKVIAKLNEVIDHINGAKNNE